jgi:lipoate-protein ligase A
MEIDTLLAEKSLKTNKAFFRFYGWKQLSVSLGYSQKSILEKYQKKEIETVIRPTGGGALIHGWDISYCLTLPPGIFKNHLQLYRFVSSVFVKTFKRLGLKEVTFSRNKKGQYRLVELCSLFPTFGEVVFKNRKLVASASRTFEGGNMLIHGTVYIHYNFPKAEEIFEVPQEVLKTTVATLSEMKIKKNLFMETFLEVLKRDIRNSGLFSHI